MAEAKLTPVGLEVLTKRYLIKGPDGTPTETVEEMFTRVAKHVADAKSSPVQSKKTYWAEKFRALMTDLLFLPNTPTFTGAGTRLGQLAACFVLPIDDDLGRDSQEGIFSILQVAALIQQSGGGVGCSWSRLRERGSIVKSCNGRSSGPIPFLRAFSASFDAISQGGTRRGANMAVLSASHPDILEFIACKQKEGDLANFNLSVAVTDEFMRAASKPGATHKLVSPATNQVVKEIDAKELMMAIAGNALFNGEPGVIFIDHINRANPCKHLYTIESTNPCVTGDTLVKTALGYKRVRDLVGVPFKAEVWGQFYSSGSNGFFRTGNKPIYELTTKKGYVLRLTEDHRVCSEWGPWVPARELRSGDRIMLENFDTDSFEKLRDLETSEDVYDCTIEGVHAFAANGIIVHNCGEQALGPFESCNLGSVNLARHVVMEEGVLFGCIDWELLQRTVETAVRFLDNVVTVNNLPHPRLRQASWTSRRIGLGFMGLADLLFATGVGYGTPLGVNLAEQVAEFIQYHAMRASVALSAEIGPFPAIKGSCYDGQNFTWTPPPPAAMKINTRRPALDWPDLVENIKKFGIRNAAMTTVAPTGTISTVAGVEGYGIEPVFSLSHVRFVLDQATGQRKPVYYTSSLFERALNILKVPEEAPVRAHVREKGTCSGLGAGEGLPPGLAEVFVTAQDLEPEQHIRMQAAVQKYFCNSISKTINLPPTADLNTAVDSISLAWRLGCRGITLYKTGSRETEVLVSGKK